MKLRQTTIAFVATMIAMALVSGCASEEFVPHNDTFYEPLSGTTLHTKDQLELNRIASALAKEPNTITIVGDAKASGFTDSQGEFKALTFQYQVQDRITTLIVPVEQTTAKGDIASYKVFRESCVMKFSGKQEGYSYEILERCKSVKMKGQGSSASLAFNDRENYGFDIPLNGSETKISVAR